MKIKINSDKEKVSDIKKRIIDNGGYCPCAFKKIEETKCMCKDFRDRIEKKEYGECNCGLYILIND